MCVQLAGCELSVCLDKDQILEAVGSEQSPIIGGDEDVSNRATLALFLTTPAGDRGLCSATSIARQGNVGYALTAAHCVQGTVDYLAMADDIEPCIPMDGDPACPDRYPALAWTAHPAYDPSTLAYDVAVVSFVIEDGIQQAPPIVPIALPDDGLEEGDVVELSGFGQISQGAKGTVPFQTQRNHVEAAIETLTDRVIRFDASLGKTSCFGDSGGPAYSTIGGVRRVVGVASSSDAECRFFGNYVRVSKVADDFIAPILAACDGPCEGTGGASGVGGAPANGGAGTGAAEPAATGSGGDAGGTSDQGGEGAVSTTSSGVAEPAGGADAPDAADCIPLVLSCQSAPTNASYGLGLWLGIGLMLRLRRRRTQP